MRLIIVLACLTLSVRVQAQFPIGHATPVSGYAPSLFSETLWLANHAYGYRIQGAPPGGSAMVAVSLGRQDQVVNGLQVYLDLANLVVVHSASVDATGHATLPSPLGSPDDPSLTGLQFYAQGAVTDPAVPGSVATTEGLLLEIALHPMAAFTMWQGTLWLLDPVTGSTKTVTGLPSNTTIRELTFANAGRDLFVTSSAGFLLVDTFNAAPHAVSVLPNPWGGVAWDRVHRRAYLVNSQAIIVIDGDRASPTFGTVIAQTPDTTNESSLALSADGRLLALASADGAVTRRDADPSSPTYLQLIPTALSPTFASPGQFLGRVHVSPDGRVVSLPVSLVFGPVSPLIHRFDGVTGAWIDHDPATPGYQALSATTYPSLPNGFGVWPARDGAAIVFGSGTVIGRINLDLHSPANVTITSTSISPPLGPNPYSALTPSGDFLVRHAATFSGTTELSFIQVSTGWSTPWVAIPNPPTSQTLPVAAWR